MSKGKKENDKAQSLEHIFTRIWSGPSRPFSVACHPFFRQAKEMTNYDKSVFRSRSEIQFEFIIQEFLEDDDLDIMAGRVRHQHIPRVL